MARLQAEIEMCVDGTHPELAAVLDQIVRARDERVQLASAHRKYRRRCIARQTRSSRVHIHQQFYKNTAAARAQLIMDTTSKWYRITKERRIMDASVPCYGYRIPEKKPTQQRHRWQQYNEIAILSGVSKYIGFPAAPAIKSASTEEVAEDMDALRQSWYHT
ncbi:Sds3-like protein [Limtongia smithiae]|uniref:Sds3-like protein n=1 Tax=Limtongia smithiae TaxID=1125753 RepID=UPI0034CDD209